MGRPWVYISACFVISYGAVPLFEENQCQLPKEVLYRCYSFTKTIYLHTNGITLVQLHEDSVQRVHDEKYRNILIPGHAVRVYWKNVYKANIVPKNPSSFYTNYFMGNDPKRWCSKVRWYDTLVYKNLYPNIDLLCYGDTEGQLKFTWVIYPGGVSEVIQWYYEGAYRTYVNEQGFLCIETSLETIKEAPPFAYQVIQGDTIKVFCRYKCYGKDLWGWELGAYNPRYPLYIDPTLIFSTYSGSYADNWGYTATYDENRNLVSGGIVVGTGFPVTTGAFQAVYAGGGGVSPISSLFYACDIGIIKYNASGTQALWATYLGGSHNEQPHSLITNKQGDVYLLGATRSTDFPTTTNTVHAGQIDAFIVCISADGTQLLASTLLGGSQEDGVNFFSTNAITNPLYFFYGDDGRSEIILDSLGRPWVTFCTRSNDMPTTPNAFQKNFQGVQDGYIAHLTANLDTLLYASYFGGSGTDGTYTIRIDPSSKIIIAGGTTSADLPTTTQALMPIPQGNVDGFIAVFSPSATTLLYCTYYGTSDYDQILVMDVDDIGRIYVAGQTKGFMQPTPGCYGAPGRKIFISVFSNDLSTLLRQALLGSDSTTVPITLSAFSLDRCNNIYLSGWGGMKVTLAGNTIPNGSTIGLPVTPNALKDSTDGKDFYFAIFDSTLSQLKYATFFGGDSSKGEHVDGGTSHFDNNNIIYQSICAGCWGFSDLPTTPNAWSTTNNSNKCNNASVKIAFDIIKTLSLDFQYTITTTQGCAPYTVTFQNLSSDTTTYTFLWLFGDGDSSTQTNPTHIYDEPGIYIVQLKPQGSIPKCLITDSVATDTIYVYAQATADFSYFAPCDTPKAYFYNLSIDATTYLWLFGDNTMSTSSNPIHIYPKNDTFTVTFITNPNTPCSDTVQKSLVLPFTQQASFSIDSLLCDSTALLKTDSNAYDTQWQWIISNGDTLYGPFHLYTFNDTGHYTIMLIRESFNQCKDTVEAEVYVRPKAQAQFSYTYDTCSRSVRLTNLSAFADSILWDLGDGTLANDSMFTHTYTLQDTTITLTLFAEPHLPSCGDTVTQSLFLPNIAQALIHLLADPCKKILYLYTPVPANHQWYINNTGPFYGDSIQYPLQDTGKYTIVLITTDTAFAQCKDTSQIDTTIQWLITAVIHTKDTLLCDSVLIATADPITLLPNYPPPYLQWQLGNGTVLYDQDSIFYHYPDSGVYQVRLTVYPGTVCEQKDSIKVIVPPSPTLSFKVERVPCTYYYVVQNLNPQKPWHYQWEIPSIWHASTSIATLPVLPQGHLVRLILKAQDSLGCSWERDTNFFYTTNTLAQLFIPSAFSPNGDGLNERLCIEGIDNTCITRMEIYNRWGERIYSSTYPDLCWDGRFQQQPAPEGVYVIVLYQQNKIVYVGSVTLLR